MAFGIFHLVLFFLPLLLAVVHSSISSKPRTSRSQVELFLLYFIVFNIGIRGLCLGLTQLFYSDDMAFFLKIQQIPFLKGCPFIRELGMSNCAFGLLGFSCLRYKGQGFWLATCIGYGLFLFFGFLSYVFDCFVLQSIDWELFVPVAFANVITPLTFFVYFSKINTIIRRERTIP